MQARRLRSPPTLRGGEWEENALPGVPLRSTPGYLPSPLVCSVGGLLRSESVAVVVFFFLALFLLWRAVDMWITSAASRANFSCRRALWQDRTGGRGDFPQGHCEARREDFPCLLFAWSTVKTGHYPGLYSESCKTGQVAT